jgi:hypothetical protein
MDVSLVGQKGESHIKFPHLLQDEQFTPLSSNLVLTFPLAFRESSLIQSQQPIFDTNIQKVLTSRMSSQVPDINLGYGFEDEQTRQQLELLDDLQKLGVSEYVDLPQASPKLLKSALCKFHY